MRCEKHPIDLSSSAGVCASCLRECLFSLIAAQTPPHAIAQPDIHSPAHPQPLLFPHSVSPKPNPPEFRNKSLLHRFHSTPQARPVSTGAVAPAKKQNRKFSLLSQLFRSRSAKFISDYDDDASSRSAHAGSISSQAAESVRISSSSPSWFPFQRGRRRGQTVSSLEDSGDSIRWKPFWVPDRGMSPPDFQEGSPSGSDSSSRHREMTSSSDPAPARRIRPLAHSNNVHGTGLCMNPLVRASSNRYGNKKRGANQETDLSGDIRAPSHPHISAAAAASDANLLRKLTEFGRANKKR